MTLLTLSDQCLRSCCPDLDVPSAYKHSTNGLVGTLHCHLSWRLKERRLQGTNVSTTRHCLHNLRSLLHSNLTFLRWVQSVSSVQEIE